MTVPEARYRTLRRLLCGTLIVASFALASCNPAPQAPTVEARDPSNPARPAAVHHACAKTFKNISYLEGECEQKYGRQPECEQIRLNDRSADAPDLAGRPAGEPTLVCGEELDAVTKSCGLTERANRLGQYLFLDPADEGMPSKVQCLIANGKYQIANRLLYSLRSRKRFDEFVPLLIGTCKAGFHTEGLDWNDAGSAANKGKLRRKYWNTLARPDNPVVVCRGHALFAVKVGSVNFGRDTIIMSRLLQALPDIDRRNLGIISGFEDVFSFRFEPPPQDEASPP